VTGWGPFVIAARPGRTVPVADEVARALSRLAGREPPTLPDELLWWSAGTGTLTSGSRFSARNRATPDSPSRVLPLVGDAGRARRARRGKAATAASSNAILLRHGPATPSLVLVRRAPGGGCS
jgi:hypothetical protein